MLSLILLDLTLREVIADIPHDGDALVVYVLIALFAAFIWFGSRGRPDAGSDGGADHGR